MGIDKSEVTKAALTSVGAHVEQQLDAIDAQAQQAKGAAIALKAQAVHLQGIIAATDRALDEPGSTDHIPDLEQLKLVKSWLAKCVHSVDSAAAHQRNQGLMLAGASAQLKATHDWLQKQVQLTAAKQERRTGGGLEVADLLASDPNVVLDEDGEPVWLGDGAAPAGIRPGNRAERRAHQNQLELPSRAPVTKAAKRATKKKRAAKANGRAANANT